MTTLINFHSSGDGASSVTLGSPGNGYTFEVEVMQPGVQQSELAKYPSIVLDAIIGWSL